jgi:hypothetical protein
MAYCTSWRHDLPKVLANREVDDNVGPIPEMIVPLRGTNHILLIDGGEKIPVEDAVQVF